MASEAEPTTAAAITWTNITVRLGDLKPWASNPRQSTKKQAEKLLQSWREFGQVETIAVSPDLDLYNGHQRLSALLTVYGKDYVIEARQSSRHLTEEEKRKLTITLHASAVGSWRWDDLSSWEPIELKEWGFDDSLLMDWRRDVASLGNFLESEEAGESKDAPPQIDRAAELQKEWGTELGQLWRLPSRTAGNEHRLICGDCTDAGVVDRLMGGDRAQMCSTDPPFNVRDDEWDKFDDFMGFTTGWLFLAKEHSITVGAFFADKFLPILPKSAEVVGLDYRRALIWVKPPGSQFAGGSKDGFWYDFELFQVYGDLAIEPSNNVSFSVFDYRTITGQEHGAEKPVGLYESTWKNYTDPNGVIYEPFCGVGSNLIAAENLFRQCRAIEIAPGYVAVALQRYQDAFGITAELIDTL